MKEMPIVFHTLHKNYYVFLQRFQFVLSLAISDSNIFAGTGGGVFFIAGTQPSEKVYDLVIEVMKEVGIDLSAIFSKSVDKFLMKNSILK